MKRSRETERQRHVTSARTARLAYPACAMALLALAPACRSHATPDDCRTMSEHYVDLAARETSGATKMSPAQLAAVRDIERGLKRAEPSFRAVEDHCGSVTRTEVSCAIDSTSTREWEGCLPDGGR
jgi:hypothetical protein